MCENYLVSAHEEDILRILEDPDKDKYFSLNINFLELFESDTNLGNELLTNPETSLKNWNEAIFIVQSNLIKKIDKKYKLKNNATCRIYSLPPWPHVCRTVFPGNDDADKFLQVTGTVVRMSARKLLEYQRQYICTKCKYPITVEALYDKRNIIKQPKKCTNPEGCMGKNIITFGELDPINCKDYQEIKIQEDLSKMGVGTVPGHMIVTLEDDLVNVCKPGENVTITGIVKRRWSEFDKGVKMTVDIVLKANHIQVNNSSGLSIAVSDDMKEFFNSFWTKYRHDPLVGRNIILNSISPEIYGRKLVKLAMAIVLAGGSPNEESQASTGVDIRSESHLLLVGDPGTGKSQMLRFASKIVPRSVLTTGVGSTAAGLTVTAIMENGEWQLEAGALVMADGGICCIDEFNSMREHDRTSIHEAMEQQTISVAKAGMVCKLKTRCSILAACNPKGNIDPSQPLCVNVAMSSPLLSRFDLILLLRDIVNEENDRKLAEYLLNKSCELSGEGVFWSLEKLQAYYAVIKKDSPKLTTEAETILSTYYQLQRKFGSRNKSRTTVRLLESLIRLSQGHAKLIYHSEVEVMDTIFAIILVDAALDYESSLLNLNIEYTSFFENPEQMYWDLLENILEKLNLDYIYQREIEKMGINIKKISQNSNVNQREDDTISNLGDDCIVSQNTVFSAPSAPKRTNLMFSQRTPNHEQPEQGIFNKSLITKQNDQDTYLNRSQFLFSQKKQKVGPERAEDVTNRLDSQASQSISEILEDSSRVTSTQKESRLLFSQKRYRENAQKKLTNDSNNYSGECSREIINQSVRENERTSTNLHLNKTSRNSDTVLQNISNDSGNMSHSSKEFRNVCSQSLPNFTQARNRNPNFSIYQNGNDSFMRNRVTVNFDTVSNSKPTELLPERSIFSKNTSQTLKDIHPGVSGKKDVLKIDGSEKKNMTLSEIVKSNSLMDFDFDLCLTNIKAISSNALGKTLKDKSLNASKLDEESGFGSQDRSNENNDVGYSVLDNDNKSIGVNNSSKYPIKEIEYKKCNSSNNTETSRTPMKGRKRDLNSPSKGGKKQCNQNEIELLNHLPSVNDEFMKYGLNIDWDLQGEENEALSDQIGDNSSTKTEIRQSLGNFCGKSTDNSGTKKMMCENMNILQESKQGNESNIKQTSEGRKSVVDLLAQFEFVSKEQRKKENKEASEGDETKCDIKDNGLKKLTEQNKKFDRDTGRKIYDDDNNELDIIASSQNAPKPPKKFKFTNKSIVNKLPLFLENVSSGNLESSSYQKTGGSDSLIDTKVKPGTRESAKINFKKIISDIDLDKDIRNFDFGTNIENPFNRNSSKFSSGSFRRNESGESYKNCHTDDIGDKIKKVSSNSDMDIENFGEGDTKLNCEVGGKHELYDLTQNSRNQFIRNTFTFNKLDIRRMASSSSTSSSNPGDM